MFSRWPLTILSVMSRRDEISVSAKPGATRARISCSRTVRLVVVCRAGSAALLTAAPQQLTPRSRILRRTGVDDVPGPKRVLDALAYDLSGCPIDKIGVEWPAVVRHLLLPVLAHDRAEGMLTHTGTGDGLATGRGRQHRPELQACRSRAGACIFLVGSVSIEHHSLRVDENVPEFGVRRFHRGHGGNWSVRRGRCRRGLRDGSRPTDGQACKQRRDGDRCRDLRQKCVKMS